MTPAETLAKSKQLDRFLGKAVTDIKSSDRTAMNKFAELALKIKSNQESMYAEADDLSTDADKTMSVFMAAAGKYRTMLDDAKAGVKAMEEAAAAMAGNGSPLPDSPPSSPPSPPVIEQSAPAPVVEEKAPASEPVVPPPVPVMDATATGNPPA